jgi:8-oxo-dGTP pyrophosphatase MutT (NUDIX family)
MILKDKKRSLMNINYRLGVMMLICRGNKFLIARKVNTDEWQLPAGGRYDGETVLATARRELLEELNINIDSALSVDVSFVTSQYIWRNEWKLKRGYDGQRRHIVIVTMPDSVEAVADGQELKEVRWVNIGELLNTLTHKDMQETIREMIKLGEIKDNPFSKVGS